MTQHKMVKPNIFFVFFSTKQNNLLSEMVSVDSELLSYAFGIVGEYIGYDLFDKLSQRLGLEKLKPAEAGKRKSLMNLEHSTLKRIKSEEEILLPNIEQVITPPRPVEKKQSAKDIKMAKAASGTKSISSFFAKK